MYLSDLTQSPQTTSRRQCIKLIFEVGGRKGYAYSLPALFSAAVIADRWADGAGDYSHELAHVALVVGTKLEDDFIYKTEQAVDEIANNIVYVMEREVFELIEYRRVPIPFFNLMTMLAPPNVEGKILGPIFECITKDIVGTRLLLEINPLALILGLKLLAQRNKLRAARRYRYSTLKRLLHQLAREYELKVAHVVAAYMAHKRSTSG
jgi:hypothetical protein